MFRYHTLGALLFEFLDFDFLLSQSLVYFRGLQEQFQIIFLFFVLLLQTIAKVAGILHLFRLIILPIYFSERNTFKNQAKQAHLKFQI